MNFNDNYMLTNVELFFSSLHELNSYKMPNNTESTPKFTCKVLLNSGDNTHVEFVKSLQGLARSIKITKANFSSRTCVKHDEYQGKEQIIFSSSARPTSDNKNPIVFINQEGEVFNPTVDNTPFKRGCIVNVMFSLWHQKEHQNRINANILCVRFVDKGNSGMFGGMSEDDIARMSQPLTPALKDGVIDTDGVEVAEVISIGSGEDDDMGYDA